MLTLKPRGYVEFHHQCCPRDGAEQHPQNCLLFECTGAKNHHHRQAGLQVHVRAQLLHLPAEGSMLCCVVHAQPVVLSIGRAQTFASASGMLTVSAPQNIKFSHPKGSKQGTIINQRLQTKMLVLPSTVKSLSNGRHSIISLHTSISEYKMCVGYTTGEVATKSRHTVLWQHTGSSSAAHSAEILRCTCFSVA